MNETSTRARRALWLSAFGAGLMSCGGAASADTLYGMMFRGGSAQSGSGANRPTYVATVNPSTGAGTVINTAPTQYVNDSMGIAINPLTGVLYGMTDNLGRINNQPLATLNARNMVFTIDPVTTNVAKVGNVAPSNSLWSEGDIKFDPITGSCWTLSTNVTAGNFVNADATLATGANGSLIGTFGPPTDLIGAANNNFDVSSFAFKPNGQLFVLDTTYPTLADRRARIYRMDRTTLGFQKVYQTTVTLGNAAGMTFDPATGDLLIADGDTDGKNQLFRYSFGSGLLTVVGDLGVKGPAGGNPSGPSIGLPDYYQGLAGLEYGKVAPSAEVKWASTSGGTYANGANWAGGTSPSGATANATFTNGASGGLTTSVTVAADVTLGRLNFRGPDRFELVAPGSGAAGTVTLTGANSVVAVSAGSHRIAVPVALASDTTFEIFTGQSLSIEAGLAGPGLIQKSGLGNLTVAGAVTGVGAVRVLAGTLDIKDSALLVGASPVHIWAGGTLKVRSLGGATSGSTTLLAAGDLKMDGDDLERAVLKLGTSRAGTPSGLAGLVTASTLLVKSDGAALGTRTYYGSIDLGDSDMVIATATLSDVRDMVRAGLASAGANGLSASAALSDPNTTLAVVSNAAAQLETFDGVAVGGAAVLVKYTWKGDTNLDGVIDGADLANYLEGYSNGLTGWQWGDFNYDGVVDPQDYLAMYNASRGQSGNFGNSTGGPPGQGTPVPEPTSTGAMLLAAAGLAASGRRRRRGA